MRSSLPYRSAYARGQSFPCHAISHRVASCPIAALPSRFRQCESSQCVSSALRLHAVRSSPYPSVAMHYPADISKLCPASPYHRVFSRRPAFPQLLRSSPIPSLPWLIHSMLFLAMRFRRPAGRFQAVLFLCHSWAGLTVPCHNTSARVQSLQCLVPSHRVASVKLRSITARAVSWCLAAIPYQRIVVLFPSWPHASVSIRLVSSAIAAMPLHILVFRGVAISCLASPIRVSSSPLCALPLPFRSNPSRTVQCLFCSLRLGSPPFLSAAVPIRALPGSSVPSPVFSGRCHAISCQLISAFAVHGHSSAVHFPSAQSRALSFRFLWARFHSVSVRILAPPLASFPILLVPAPVPASPYLRHANLGESVLRSTIALHLLSRRN